MLKIGHHTLTSRFLLGTAQYPSPAILCEAIQASAVEVITVSLRRQGSYHTKNTFWRLLQSLPCHLLPNTAGCYRAKEAILTAKMARELFETNWIKLEVIGDSDTLQPNPFELLNAAEILIQEGFEVFPYCTEDIVLCQRLVDCGCRVLMPWAAPIGSAQGPLNPYALKLLRNRFPDCTLIIDAGIGRPSHATQVMEFGYDAVLLNSAVALADNPVKMASAFANAINAGRQAYEIGMLEPRNMAFASTPLIGMPFWHEEEKEKQDEDNS